MPTMASSDTPDLVDLSGAELERLKSARTELGDWHDRMQWLARAARETDLQPLCARWQGELERVDRVLLVLEKRLTKAVA